MVSGTLPRVLVRRILPLLSVVALLLGAAIVPAQAAKTPPVLPPERPYPAVLDAPIEYEGMTTCDPTPRPGALALRKLILDTYGEAVIGISRACDQDSISEHKEGRAVDWMVDFRNKAKFAQAQAFVDWVTAKGPDGTPAANARRLGIMYIGWADKMWRAYDPGRGWTELKGCFSLQDSGHDTFCHRDHVHFSMTWDGAAARTSYWDNTPVLDQACPVTSVPGSAGTLRTSSAFVPVSPVRVFDGRKKGANGCYLQQRRWTGDDRSVPVRVTGKGKIPKSGVDAVAVRVTAYSSNAPGWLNAAASRGSGGPKVVSLGMEGPSAATAIVPVSSSGRIWLATVAGHARVAVDVLGYFARTSTSAAGEQAGTWSPTPAALAAKVTVPAGGTQTVKLQGAPKAVTGASLTVVTSGSADGHIRLTPPGSRTAADEVHVAKGVRSAAVFVATTDGSISVTNTSGAAAEVSLVLTGWITEPTAGMGRLAPMSRELGSVKGSATPQTVSGALPADAKAVVLSVTAKGAAKGGGLTLWGAGQRPAARSIDVLPRRSNTELVVVSLGEDRAIRAAGDVPKATGSIRLVGVIK